ncbi:MAG: adenylate/guanylate cyclase domain-containing protein, partial [Desulfamplus sp.]|nr:adenylate/guanylate cyclase domain-containing protein [Desulfamplus sp.]
KKDKSQPFYGVKALTQHSNFAIKAKGSGDISAMADADGIYRHITMMVKIDDKYFPTLALSVFLDWVGISLDEITVEWGEKITIPASKANPESAGNFLGKDVVIPIDRHGRTFIPFVNVMGKDFIYISANKFLSHFEDENLRGNLLELFEGNFVFIGDIAIGTSDLGYTPLQNDAPLVITHSSLLNALLTNTFYSEWQLGKTFLLILLLLVILASASIVRSSWSLYGIFSVAIVSILFFTWFEFLSFRLFPVFTVVSILLLIFLAFITTLETSGSKERAFIRNTFARYVPEKVVNTLLAQPEMVTLGGEERVITVLFSDIANFTTISESLSPTELVHLLNEYFTEMVDIIMQNGGIIDKFQGDSIMAEFGVPLPLEDHADRAVTAALQMLNRLSELRGIWKKRNQDISEQNGQIEEQNKNFPAKPNKYDIYCRIGINTNNMIVGNMGSKNVLDYTVIGDAVNLASRLEGANKNYGTYLMISEFTYKQLTQCRFKTRILDYIRVKGKTEPVLVYEVYGEARQD